MTPLQWVCPLLLSKQQLDWTQIHLWAVHRWKQPWRQPYWDPWLLLDCEQKYYQRCRLSKVLQEHYDPRKPARQGTESSQAHKTLLQACPNKEQHLQWWLHCSATHLLSWTENQHHKRKARMLEVLLFASLSPGEVGDKDKHLSGIKEEAGLLEQGNSNIERCQRWYAWRAQREQSCQLPKRCRWKFCAHIYQSSGQQEEPAQGRLGLQCLVQHWLRSLPSVDDAAPIVWSMDASLEVYLSKACKLLALIEVIISNRRATTRVDRHIASGWWVSYTAKELLRWLPQGKPPPSCWGNRSRSPTKQHLNAHLCRTAQQDLLGKPCTMTTHLAGQLLVRKVVASQAAIGSTCNKRNL